ncbi:MAG: hypothetical protein IKN81_09300, partial [Oscillospiraceae bacterium]|nr:hypothetical protein [Oscillospiraceae bacterium]
KQMLRGIRVRSKQELADRIYRYFEEVNAEPVVFRWKYKLDDIDISEDPRLKHYRSKSPVNYQTLYL